MSSSVKTLCPQKSLGELKIRSRILIKAANNGDQAASKLLKSSGNPSSEYRHKDGLNIVSRLAGFKNWQHALHILSGAASSGEDMGTLWYDRSCSVLLNIWCRNYEEAEEEFRKTEDGILVPYKNQFIVGNDDYQKALGLSIQNELLQAKPNRNLAKIYGTQAWDQLVFERIQSALGPANSYSAKTP